jgi:hypothetical protein
MRGLGASQPLAPNAASSLAPEFAKRFLRSIFKENGKITNLILDLQRKGLKS